jgi:hypothetical protein
MHAMRRFSHWTQSKYGSRPINSEARAVCLPCAGHQRFLALSSERNQLAQARLTALKQGVETGISTGTIVS